MPNWRKLLVSGSDASLNSLNVTTNVTAQSFTGSFSGSIVAPGATTQVLYNNGGEIAAASGLVYNGSNVGIGTTNPQYPLDLGTGGAGNSIRARRIYANGTGIDSGFTVDNTLIYQDASGTFNITNPGSYPNVAFTINNSGNIGIGTTSPAYKLDVFGSPRFYGDGNHMYTRIFSGASNKDSKILIGNDAERFNIGLAASTNTFSINSSNGGTPTSINIDYTTGYVGIGTTSPTSLLHLNSSAATNLYIQSGTGNEAIIRYFSGTTEVATARANSSGSYLIETGVGSPNEKMRITSAGNVGIGTTNPGTTLDVIGDIRASNYVYGSVATITPLVLNVSANDLVVENATVGYNLLLKTNGAERMRVTNLGSVGIGTFSPAATLEVNGNVKAVSFTGSFSGSVSAPGSTTQIVYNDNGVLAANSGLVYSGSNVGIGTASPSQKFVVSNGSAEVFKVYSTGEIVAGTNYIYAAYSAGTSFYSQGAASFRDGIYNDTGTYLTINGGTSNNTYFNGNVGIGTTSPGNKLHIVGAANGTDAGNIRIDSTDQFGGLVINENTTFRTFLGYGNANSIFSNAQSDSTALRAANYLHLGASSVATITINASDNVGIGTTSPLSKLHVRANTNQNFRISSGTNLEVASIDDADSAYTPLTFRASKFDFQNGNVGIGTTNPSGKLHIADDGPNALKIGDTQVSTIGETNDGGYPGMKIVPYNSNIHIGISSTNDNKINLWYAGTNYTYWQQLSTYSVISNYSTDALVFQVNGGNVGIGTTSPSAPLAFGKAVYGDPSSENFYRIKFEDFGGIHNDVGIGQPATAALGFNAGAGGYISFNEGTNGERVRIAAGGNVGIGTTSPSQKLEVNGGDALIRTAYIGNISAFGTNYASFSHISRTGSGDYSLLSGNDGTTYINAKTSAPIRFRIDNTDKAIIDSSGNVGIGTTTPVQKLDVAGSFILSSNATYIMSKDAAGNTPRMFGINSSNDTYIGPIDTYAGGAVLYGVSANVASQTFYTGATARLHITSGGNVGIGTISPGAELAVNSANSNTRIFIQNAGSSKLEIGYGPTGYGFTHPTGEFVAHNDNLYFGQISGAATNVTFTTAGNVGIGTTSPSQLVEAYQSFNGDVVYQISNPNAGTSATAQFFASNGTTRTQFFHTGTSYNGTGILASSAGLGGIYNNTAQGIALLASSAAGPIRFGTTTSNTERMRITSGGNVGIGTSSPSKKLELGGGGSYTPALRFSEGTAGYFADFGYKSDGNKVYLSITDGSVEKDILVANYNGNVGIGYTSPSQKLHVSAGNFLISGTAIGSGADANSGLRIVAPISTTHYNWMLGAQQNINSAFEITPSTTVGGTTFSTPTAVFLQNGNVGIGTTNPTAQLHIKSTGEATLTLDSAASNASTIYFKENGTSTHYISADGSVANNPLKFYDYTLGAVAMTINAGNVGIGTTNPGEKLQVNGNIYVVSGVVYGASSYSDSAVNKGMSFSGTNLLLNNSGERLRIDSSGNVGIGTASPTQKLDVAGAISVSGSVVDYKVSPAAIGGVTTSNIVSFTPGVTKAAFIDYVIIDSAGGTNQRVGTIMVSISLNTVSAVITETTTVDIGNTSAITFAVAYGAPTWLTATNSGPTPYDISYMVRYF